MKAVNAKITLITVSILCCFSFIAPAHAIEAPKPRVRAKRVSGEVELPKVEAKDIAKTILEAKKRSWWQLFTGTEKSQNELQRETEQIQNALKPIVEPIKKQIENLQKNAEKITTQKAANTLMADLNNLQKNLDAQITEVRNEINAQETNIARAKRAQEAVSVEQAKIGNTISEVIKAIAEARNQLILLDALKKEAPNKTIQELFDSLKSPVKFFTDNSGDIIAILDKPAEEMPQDIKDIIKNKLKENFNQLTEMMQSTYQPYITELKPLAYEPPKPAVTEEAAPPAPKVAEVTKIAKQQEFLQAVAKGELTSVQESIKPETREGLLTALADENQNALIIATKIEDPTKRNKMLAFLIETAADMPKEKLTSLLLQQDASGIPTLWHLAEKYSLALDRAWQLLKIKFKDDFPVLETAKEETIFTYLLKQPFTEHTAKILGRLHGWKSDIIDKTNTANETPLQIFLTKYNLEKPSSEEQAILEFFKNGLTRDTIQQAIKNSSLDEKQKADLLNRLFPPVEKFVKLHKKLTKIA